jgi:hypothetical protein
MKIRWNAWAWFKINDYNIRGISGKDWLIGFYWNGERWKFAIRWTFRHYPIFMYCFICGRTVFYPLSRLLTGANMCFRCHRKIKRAFEATYGKDEYGVLFQ